MNENGKDWDEGSGNVFRDLGDPQADLKQAKAILAARIIAALDERELTVRKAASTTGFAAADFSRIRNADLGRFTLDRLMKMLGGVGWPCQGFSACRPASSRGSCHARVSGIRTTGVSRLRSHAQWGNAG